jgi:glutamyl-tRNA reductase
MRVGVVGVNFKSSPLEVREQLAKICQYCFSSCTLSPKRRDVILLSTCNRTEIYFSAQDLANTHSEILGTLRELIDIPFEQNLYSFFGADCFSHLAKVAAGLDSAILAETEIQQQVRRAYRLACSSSLLNGSLHFLFQKALKISKEIRTKFPLPRGLASLESVLFELIARSEREILLIGNSQINRQIINFFQAKGGYKMSLCTRSIEGAEEFAQEKGIQILGWETLIDWRHWDIVICATQHPFYVIKQDGQPAVKPQFLIDLSVPRLIDPALAIDPLVHLINMEELASIVDSKRRRLLKQIGDSQTFLETAVENCLDRLQQKEARRHACIGF